MGHAVYAFSFQVYSFQVETGDELTECVKKIEVYIWLNPVYFFTHSSITTAIIP